MSRTKLGSNVRIDVFRVNTSKKSCFTPIVDITASDPFDHQNVQSLHRFFCDSNHYILYKTQFHKSIMVELFYNTKVHDIEIFNT